MDPLTALNFAVSPELRAARMSRVGKALALELFPRLNWKSSAAGPGAAVAPATSTAPGSFDGTLGKMIGEVNSRQAAAGERSAAG